MNEARLQVQIQSAEVSCDAGVAGVKDRDDRDDGSEHGSPSMLQRKPLLPCISLAALTAYYVVLVLWAYTSVLTRPYS